MSRFTVYFGTMGIALLGAVVFVALAVAQTTPPSTPITRTVVAQTKLWTAGNVPLYFSAVGVVIPPGETSTVLAAAHGILYQMSGSTEVTVGGEATTLNAHEGLFITRGKQASLKASGGIPSTLMHFLLGRVVDLDRSAAMAPATVVEVFRTPGPIPGLKPGPYDLNLSLVTFPPHTPSNPPHHRSGAALYYILSGTGTNTVEAKTAARGVGSVIYEPFGLVHQWGNPGEEPLRFVAFNINPEGVPAVVPGAPVKAR
jgi:quercetin dioxygenase-like cupin family protein